MTEWVGLACLIVVSVGSGLLFAPRVDGRSFGAWVAARIVCAATGEECPAPGDDRLTAAYGPGDAGLVRRFAPSLVYEHGTLTLPVDPASCRSHLCSDAPDRGVDTAASRTGEPATALTHVVHRAGGAYIQYWFYYPDSNTTLPGLGRAWRLLPGHRPWPGFHLDDWEGYFVRIDARGRASARASSHHGFRYCKQRRCRHVWGGVTGWTRVSRGSHAGHVPLPGVDPGERTTAAGELRLIPLETYDRARFKPLDPSVRPPWLKRLWLNPEADTTG